MRLQLQEAPFLQRFCLEAVAAGLTQQQFTHSCGNQQHDDVCLAHCSLGFTMVEDATVYTVLSSGLGYIRAARNQQSLLQETPVVMVCDSGAFVGAGLPTCPTAKKVSFFCKRFAVFFLNRARLKVKVLRPDSKVLGAFRTAIKPRQSLLSTPHSF